MITLRTQAQLSFLVLAALGAVACALAQRRGSTGFICVVLISCPGRRRIGLVQALGA